MSRIVCLLDKLAEVQAELDAINADIEAAIPAHLRAKRNELAADVKNLDAEIRDRAKYIPEVQAHTLVGRFFQLVWVPGGPVSYYREGAWQRRKCGKK